MPQRILDIGQVIFSSTLANMTDIPLSQTVPYAIFIISVMIIISLSIYVSSVRVSKPKPVDEQA
jgi:hypothetical protein